MRETNPNRTNPIYRHEPMARTTSTIPEDPTTTDTSMTPTKPTVPTTTEGPTISADSSSVRSRLQRHEYAGIIGEIVDTGLEAHPWLVTYSIRSRNTTPVALAPGEVSGSVERSTHLDTGRLRATYGDVDGDVRTIVARFGSVLLGDEARTLR